MNAIINIAPRKGVPDPDSEVIRGAISTLWIGSGITNITRGRLTEVNLSTDNLEAALHAITDIAGVLPDPLLEEATIEIPALPRRSVLEQYDGPAFTSAVIEIVLQTAVSDPEGNTVVEALAPEHPLLSGLRFGRVYQVTLEPMEPKAAMDLLSRLTRDALANPTTETWRIIPA